MRVVLVERREIVGGACVTEEFAPGFRASSGAYVLSMLRGSIWRDMRLSQRGIRVDPAGPSLNIFDDGAALTLPDDVDGATTEIRRFSRPDARAFGRFEADLAAMAQVLAPLFDWTPPNLGATSLHDTLTIARLASRSMRHRANVQDLAYIFATSATQYLAERFESEYVRSAIGWHAINDSTAGPSTPGTAFVLLHDHAAEETGGGLRQWGFVRGGMGQLTLAMADAAREAGVEIRTGVAVERILVSAGHVTGVALEDGTMIESACIASNADPKRTFLQLLTEADVPVNFAAAIREYRCEGTSMKINVALGELPRATFDQGRSVEPYHRGVIEITSRLDDMDRDQALARRGIPAPEPHIEMCIPTVHDPSLAPLGRHVLTIDVNSQPYSLATGSWDQIAASVADRAIERIGQHFPNVPGAVVDRQVLSPLDLQRILGLSGGHALHGEMSADQLFSLRPIPGFGDYRTPIHGLYLCGAGTHPGGGVSGANGRNCAREIVRDRRQKHRFDPKRIPRQPRGQSNGGRNADRS